jgi:2',3'-cyclic-nucleotide 2'-phosphodiesterase (5'-nucleotidase family)
MDHGRMSATEYRARFDAVVTFSNGGGLRADGFRVDVPGPDVTEQDVASLFIASLNLLMVRPCADASVGQAQHDLAGRGSAGLNH